MSRRATSYGERLGYQENVGSIVGPDEVLCMSLNETGPVVIETNDDFIVLW